MISRSISELPWILCGPILRKVESDSVTVFIAFKQQTSVTLIVYEGQQSGTQPPDETAEVLREHAESTVALGKNLHVLAIEAGIKPPERSLSNGKIYSYDLQISDPNSSKKSSLAGESLLTGAHPLGYSPGDLPTFALSPGLKDLNLFHGSCRKPHGHGRDALPILDSHIQANRNQPTNRPHQLLLTGDQIYSDDVALALLKTITKTGLDLLDWSQTESIPLSDGEVVKPTDAAVKPGPALRGQFIAEETNYSAGAVYRQGHLMFLHEFYIMYLMAWSNVLWPRDGNGEITIATMEETLGPSGLRPKAHKKEEFVNDQVERRERALTYASTLPLVRRVLANVPTCMIFDDHEITDDWYLDAAWEDAVKADNTSRQLVRNGLLAYAVFQDWGNQHHNYVTDTLGAQLLDAVRWSSDEGLPEIVNHANMCNSLLDITPPTEEQPGIDERLHWDFEVIGEEYKVILLDTRTWRAEASDPGNGTALISKEAMVRQIDQRKPRDAILPIIVSPAPAIGNLMVETLQKWKVSTHEKPDANYEYDNEAWTNNRKAYERLLRHLSTFGKVIVLSGDVHYGFSIHLAYFNYRQENETKARLIQFCASPFKNQDAKTNALEQAGYPSNEIGYFGLGMESDLADAFKVIKDKMYPEGVPGTRENPAKLGEIFDRVILRYILLDAMKEPAILPTGPWQSDEAVKFIKTLVDDPNWEYTIRFMRDSRTADQRTGAVALPSDWNDWDDVYKHIIQNGARSIVGHNNIGQVRFSSVQANSVDYAVHRLHWYIVDPNYISTSVAMYSEFKTPLTLPDDADKPEVSK